MRALNLKYLPENPYVSDRVDVSMERGTSNILWATMAAASEGARQNFSLPLLESLRDLIAALGDSSARWPAGGELVPAHYLVLRSAHPDYFSLGGDLEYFRACIARRDREGLLQYSRLCLDIIFAWATRLNHSATTVALVQGRALGGGFETALSADYLIAEEHAEFGFPEILFGLFPCTGGMSLLARRVGVYEAERMMVDGRIYSAAELKERGIVDAICPRGEGVLGVHQFISAHGKHRDARLHLQRARHRMTRLDYRELTTVVEEWVEAALQLGDADLKVMDMLIRLQRGMQAAAD